jgi:Cys-tRNA(Pro)/Cys-tRNA(Cys) deacylase
MTPAIDLLKKQQIAHRVHEYTHDPQHASYGLEAAEKLGVSALRVFKTLVVKLDTGQLAVAVLPVEPMLSMKQMARACDVKKADMADKVAVQRSTGYVLGGVSPLAQKKRLPTLIDDSAKNFSTIFVSAGRRGLEIELTPQDLLALTSGQFASLCQ